MRPWCILALDLGTSAFKCAPVVEGQLLGEPVELPYALDYRGDSVTLGDPEQYARLALDALAAGAELARGAGAEVGAVGICSQAQTFVVVDELGAPVGPARTWLDKGAVAAADEISRLVGDYAARTGFPNPSPQQFLPKVLREVRHPESRCDSHSFLLLNEFIIRRLTGHAYGDTTQQGMGGFYNISARAWNEDLSSLARIRVSQLAPVYPAARYARPLTEEIAARLGLSRLGVYSCGNDQCCSAIGAGLTGPGEAGCNFGTAMVVYTVTSEQRTDLQENQIGGIDPLTGGYFLLGYDSDCGHLVESARRNHSPGVSIDEMIRTSGSAEVRSLLGRLSGSFGRLLSDLGLSASSRLTATGGLSRSAAWLELLERDHGVRFEKSPHEHASLLGIAAVVERHVTNPGTAG
jgi:sugar (pentulose or hexulose) kinase